MPRKSSRLTNPIISAYTIWKKFDRGSNMLNCLRREFAYLPKGVNAQCV